MGMTESEATKLHVGIIGSGRKYPRSVGEYMDSIEELEQYRAIGTVSDFRELKEKATAKKPKLEQVEIDYYEYDCLECPNCGGFIGYATECEEEHYQIGYCPCCGQKLDWSEGKE